MTDGAQSIGGPKELFHHVKEHGIAVASERMLSYPVIVPIRLFGRDQKTVELEGVTPQ
ncbi:MAG: hypothetical protein HXS48_19175 [Theionarchaea archaeon]|nr:hypothetical protein [Theionarchaea archaeon]